MSGRSIGLLVGATLLGILLVINGIVSMVAVKALEDGYEQEENVYQKLRALTLLLSAMQDVETGQRGYLLTNDTTYLEPYTDAVARVGSLMVRVDALGPEDPALAADLPALRAHAQRRIDLAEETIARQRAGDRAAALDIVRAGQGKEAMDGVRDIVAAAQDRTQDDLRTQTRLATATARRAALTIGFSNLALFLVAVTMIVVVRRNLRTRERTTAELRGSNAALSAALADRQAALSHIQAMQAQLVQQEKLASLGRLTAGVAHEMKNPLNFINNFAGLVHEQAEEVATSLAEGNTAAATATLADLRQNADRIVAHGRRADDIVRSMLVHARGVSGDREEVHLHDILNTAVEQGLGAIPEGTRAIQVDRVYDPALDTTPVMAVPSALGRLFLNLIENAAQAVRQRAGGESEGYVPTIEIETKLGEDRMGRAAATIIVSDNGPGIPDAVLPRVFEPFYTTKGPGQGTGLGLSLAYDIALGHGGSLVADHTDADEAGAVFIVTLPLRPAEEPEAAESVEE